MDADTSAPPAPPPPQAWDVDVVLASGLTARVRQIRPSDADGIVAFHEALSPISRQRRYFTPMPHLGEKMIQRFVNVDHVDREALVVEAGDTIVGLGQYERAQTQPTDAEVAFAVADELQGQGIGTLLLEHLASLARARGIERFVAETLGSNQAMLHVFARAGFDVHRRFNDGVYELDFAIAPTTASEQLREEREHRATVASITRLLRPASIAVDEADGSIEAMLATGAAAGAGYRGTVLAPGNVAEGTDLVVLDLPPGEIVEAGWRWSEAGAGAFMVMSESAPEAEGGGPLVVRQLVRTARRHGMRVLGPRAFGLVNTDPEVGLSILAEPHRVLPGRIGVFADTAVSAAALLDELAERGIGISSFVGAGDKADISANDLLEYWEADPATDVILLAFGTFGNPRRFASLARRVTQRKPIVVVTPATPLVDALCRRTGVLRADSLDDLADLARRLAYQGRWNATPSPEVPAPADVDLAAARRVGVDALTRDLAGGDLTDDEVRALLASAGLPAPAPVAEGEWTRTLVLRGGRAPLFGATVEVIPEEGAPARLALAPLTTSDLHALSYGHPCAQGPLVRLAAVMDVATEIASVELTIADDDTPRILGARATAAQPTGLIHRARHLN